MREHHAQVVKEQITITRDGELRERVDAYRAHCSCGYLGSPFIREHVAEHEVAKHLEATADEARRLAEEEALNGNRTRR